MTAGTGGRRRVRRRVALLSSSAGTAVVLFAVHTGWLFPGPSAWPAATGWLSAPGAPAPSSRVSLAPGEVLGLYWLGHAGFLLEWRGTRILLDPNLSHRCTVVPRILEAPATPAELGAVDAALVSHAHYDHLDLPTLEGVPRLGAVVVPRGSEGYVQELAASGAEVVGLVPGESLSVGALQVTAVPAAHNGNRHHPLASRKLAVGYVLRAGETAVYFAGDTGFGPHLAAIGRAYRPRLAILPIGAYAPRWPMRFYHLSPEEAVAAAQALGRPLVVPCHFGTFVLSADRPSSALPRFARAAGRAGVDWLMPELLNGSSGPVAEVGAQAVGLGREAGR